eukprot:g2954.t1
MASSGDPVCKLILVGNGSVGKSSIIARFTDDGFGRVYKQTVGLDFFEKLLVIRGDKRIRLQVWDIGGQSVGSKMIGKYIYGSDIVFLCYDVTDVKSFTDIEDWLRLVRRTFSEAVAAGVKKKPLVYLAGNKIDLYAQRKITEEQHDRFVREERLKGGLFLSAQSGENVLTFFYQAAADLQGIKLTANDLDFTRKALAVSILNTDDSAQTDVAKQVMEEDGMHEGFTLADQIAREEAQGKRGGKGKKGGAAKRYGGGGGGGGGGKSGGGKRCIVM